MTDRVTDYAAKVVAGDVLCGRLHRLACQRHLRDLARQDDPGYPFKWDVEASNRILDFAETLTLSEGAEPRPLKLMDCQAFDLGCTFGWLKKSNGARRFRRRYKCISRQQGKTMENGIMGPYIAAFSGYRYGKLFTVANRKKQARLAWEEMEHFIYGDADLSELFTVKGYKNTIIANNTGSTIEALSREAGLDEGFRSIYASIDELHQHPDGQIYSKIYKGTRSLKETLVSMITTRGSNMNSFCYEMDQYAIKVLEGITTAEDFFVDIFCLDDGDDPWDERNWPKAAPFTCADPERLQTMRESAKAARDMGGSELAEFITKDLNMWVRNTDTQFIAPDLWLACGTDRDLAEITKITKDCWVGLDLSSGGDLTTLALEFELPDGRTYIYSHSFMPRGRIQEHQETDLAPYGMWEQKGLITVTGGDMDFMNDYKFIIRHLQELQSTHELNFLGIGIDPHNAAGVMQDLEAFGCDVVVIKQSCQSLNDATVSVQLLVKGQKIEFDCSNELLSWSASNAALVRNSFGEIKIDKKPGARFKRIDPIDAMIDAHALALIQRRPEEKVDLDEALSEYLDAMGWSSKE